MWIRSQNRRLLVKTEDICVLGCTITACDRDCTLGEYYSEERALEVLYMIESRIIKGSKFDSINNSKRTMKEFIFKMPEE